MVQLVKVMRGGEEVRMSKRAGEFVTLRDLVEEVGVDAARYFFLMRRGDSPFDFDVDLAKRQTDENPVFYVQMAHARLSGIFRDGRARARDVGTASVDLAALPAPEDAELLKKLGDVPRGRGARRARARAAPHHRLPHELATDRRTAGITTCRVLGEPEGRDRARPPAARARGAHRARQRPRPARHLRPRPDVTR